MNRVLVLGGGQLGLMMAEAAARLGLVVDRYDPERALLLPGTSDLAVPITWEECLERYPVVTVEREAFPDSGLSARLAASDRCVARGALAVIPDRYTQKSMLDELGIATAPWRNLDQVEDLAATAAEFGGVVVKARSGGYDGRGTWIVGDGAYLDDLRERHADAALGDDAFAEFATNQALIALERSERIFRGARYKVPRTLPGDVFANPDFRNLMANIAQQRDRPVHDVFAQAERYLREMAATQTPFTLEMINALYRAAVRSHHDAAIDINEDQLQRVAETIATRPVIFLISHKSMLDTVALSLVLFDANLPLPLTFGGINLNTPGLGALIRRSGIIFLRRSFQDNEIYKSTFRRYIDYLIEKRFSLLWALEGTRSRTGKLLPPRFGLFSYVVESILRTRLHDVTFIPVSVAYDQITEVEDYSIEQRGQTLVDADIDAKDQSGLLSDIGVLKKGQTLRLDSSPHFGTESPGQWRLGSLTVRRLNR